MLVITGRLQSQDGQATWLGQDDIIGFPTPLPLSMDEELTEHTTDIEYARKFTIIRY